VSDPVLAVQDLVVAYRGVEAVRGVSLSVAPGEIATVIGANGAGKSTLLNAIMGILPASGVVRFCGTALADMPVEERVGLGMCLVPEKRELFTTMTVEDNLRLGALRLKRERNGAGRAGLIEVFALFPRLEERRRQLAGTLSGGERQMLATGRALMGKPRLLMLDEPSLGLAPLIVREIFRTIAALRESGVAILLVEQNARAALQIADHGYLLENGSVVLSGPSAELRADERIVETYLGVSAAAGA
jgi:branched-chain amino acid transport system ATP-binding protein